VNGNNNLYSILNVSNNATLEDIKKSYKKLIIKNHPDKNQNSPDINKYNEKFIKIKDAYEILSDEHKRKLYDASLNNFKNHDIKTIIKIKTENILKFIKNPFFYLLFFGQFMSSGYNFINNFLINGNITEILNINQTIEFTIYEYYNNIPKKYKFKRLTKDKFEEYIFAIDLLQVYENEGELINIDGTNINGNFIINIKISSTIYKKVNYYIFENDLMIFINKSKIKNNKIKLEFLDDNVYSFKINNLLKASDLINHPLNLNKEEYSNIYYIENMGLPYFNENQDMENINLNNIQRGYLFFILII
jgi:curved DNA-binding protein CbpA